MKRFVRILALALATVLLCGMLVSCVPLVDSVKVETALLDAGYTVSFADDVIIGSYMSEGIDLDEKLIATLSFYDTNTRQRTEEYVVVCYFPDIKTAKKAMERVTAEANAEKNDKYVDWIEPTCFGNVVYYGTKSAVEAAKK